MNRVQRLAWGLAAHAYGPVDDVWRGVKTALARPRRELPSEGRAAFQQLRGASRLAVVVIHPRFVEFSIRHLVSALTGAGFAVAAMSSEPVPDPLARCIQSAGGRIVPRRNFGRDMGAYADAMRYLHEEADAFPALEWLVLANDSMYWPRATRDHLRRMLEEGAPWSCLTESFVGRYHAQSYFVCLSAAVALSSTCRKFWRDYRPHDRRRHAIRKGEIGLTRSLVRTFGKPFCLFSGGRLVEAILDGLDAEAAAVVTAELMTGGAAGHEDVLQAPAALLADHHRAETALRHRRPASAVEIWWREEIARRMADIALDHNPTHRLARSLNLLFEAPLKRDIGFRRTWPIGAVPSLWHGYAPEERREIEQDLRERGLPNDLSLAHRLLIHTGRL